MSCCRIDHRAMEFRGEDRREEMETKRRKKFERQIFESQIIFSALLFSPLHLSFALLLYHHCDVWCVCVCMYYALDEITCKDAKGTDGGEGLKKQSAGHNTRPLMQPLSQLLSSVFKNSSEQRNTIKRVLRPSIYSQLNRIMQCVCVALVEQRSLTGDRKFG